MRNLILALLLGLSSCLAAGAAEKSYPYGGYLPLDYNDYPDDLFPMIIFLHGAGETTEQENIIPAYARAHPGFPFIVITPRATRDWSVARLENLMQELRARFRFDPRRVYLTGLSMGSFGAFKLAVAHPEWFAGVVMIAGGGEPAEVCKLKDVPLWLIHNRADLIVPVRHTEELAAALTACKGKLKVTINEDPGAGTGPYHHNAWHDVYNSPAIYQWMTERERP